MVTLFQERKVFDRKQYVCRPTGQPCLDTKEFNLVRNMISAVIEERYKDAGMFPSVFFPILTKF